MRTMTYAFSHSNPETRMYYVEHQPGDKPLDTLTRAQSIAGKLTSKGYEAHAFKFYDIAMIKASRKKA